MVINNLKTYTCISVGMILEFLNISTALGASYIIRPKSCFTSAIFVLIAVTDGDSNYCKLVK